MGQREVKWQRAGALRPKAKRIAADLPICGPAVEAPLMSGDSILRGPRLGKGAKGCWSFSLAALAEAEAEAGIPIMPLLLAPVFADPVSQGRIDWIIYSLISRHTCNCLFWSMASQTDPNDHFGREKSEMSIWLTDLPWFMNSCCLKFILSVRKLIFYNFDRYAFTLLKIESKGSGI